MIPSQPVMSSKPWNCLSQQDIDSCRHLIGQAELHWSQERHNLFTPSDRRAVAELLKVGRRLEQRDNVFIDMWPMVLQFCGRGWFDVVETTTTTTAVCADDASSSTRRRRRTGRHYRTPVVSDTEMEDLESSEATTTSSTTLYVDYNMAESDDDDLALPQF